MERRTNNLYVVDAKITLQTSSLNIWGNVMSGAMLCVAGQPMLGKYAKARNLRS
jgi:hypothetical protein